MGKVCIANESIKGGNAAPNLDHWISKSYQLRIRYFKCYTSIKAILTMLTHNTIGNHYRHICSQVSNWAYHHKNSSSQTYLVRWLIWELV